MGSDYYAYTVLGVKAHDYIKSGKFTIELPKTVDGKEAFDVNGNMLMREQKFNYLSFNGVNFSGEFTYFNEQRKTKIEPPIPICEDSLNDYLKEFELKWISYDYQFVYKTDTLGLVINRFEEDGIERWQIADLWEKAQLALAQVNITEYPKLYTGFYHSY